MGRCVVFAKAPAPTASPTFKNIIKNFFGAPDTKSSAASEKPEDLPVPGYCMGGRPCHLDCSGGESQWLPGAGVNNTSGCGAPLAPNANPSSPPAGVSNPIFGDIPDLSPGDIPEPVILEDAADTSPPAGVPNPFFGDIPDLRISEDAADAYCPFINGCHLECQINKYRLKAGEGSIPDGITEGDPCVSPPSAMRPSIFNKVVSGIMRLFYRPAAQ